MQRPRRNNETCRRAMLVGVLGILALLASSRQTTADDLYLDIKGVVADSSGGSFVVTATPDPANSYIPGAYAINLLFDEFSPGLNDAPLGFNTANVLPGMIELGQNIGTTPHPGTFNEGAVIQYVAAGATSVPGSGTSLMQFEFTVPGGFNPASQGFRVTIVPAHPSNPDLYVTYAGEGFDLILGSAVIGTLNPAFDLCDINRDGSCDVADIDALTAAIVNASTTAAMDLNGDGDVNQMDRDVWVHDLMHLYYGDSNLDGVFDTSDLVFVLQQGQFEDGVVGNSTWASGDWSGDLEFDTSDFVTAFQDGGFENGPRGAVAAVPEPASLATMSVGLCAMLWHLSRKR